MSSERKYESIIEDTYHVRSQPGYRTGFRRGVGKASARLIGVLSDLEKKRSIFITKIRGKSVNIYNSVSKASTRLIGVLSDLTKRGQEIQAPQEYLSPSQLFFTEYIISIQIMINCI